MRTSKVMVRRSMGVVSWSMLKGVVPLRVGFHAALVVGVVQAARASSRRRKRSRWMPKRKRSVLRQRLSAMNARTRKGTGIESETAPGAVIGAGVVVEVVVEAAVTAARTVAMTATRGGAIK